MTQTPMTLRADLHEPRHRGLHLAVLGSDEAERLGFAGSAGRSFVRLTHPTDGRQGFARLHIAEEMLPGSIAVQPYILDNCGVEPGTDVLVSSQDPAELAPAVQVRVREVGEKRLGLQSDVVGVRQRLRDSMLPLLVGHRLELPIRREDVVLEIVSTQPAGEPVVCREETEVEIEEMAIVDDPQIERHVSFADIGGLEEPIRRIQEIVVFPSRNPDVFRQLGIRPPKGVLLYGPPGSGKTLLARAVAKSFDAAFFSINGPEILSKFYGQSEQQLRDVFAKAANQTPSVVFIDELDSIAPAREKVSGDLEVRLVSQLLTLMDGLEQRGQIVVIGATNRVSAIDPALRRPGRFDSEVEILPPNVREREAILRVHTRAMKLADDVDLGELSRRTTGYVGADLASLCQEAALAVIRRVFVNSMGEGKPSADGELRVSGQDFAEALRRVQPSAFRELAQPDTTADWDDLTGLPGCKDQLIELIEWPLKREGKLKEFGITSGQGVLLLGPPLSGKTSLVAALARKLELSLVYLRSADLLAGAGWLGEAEDVVRRAFRKARFTEPSIVFIDEFEQVASVGGELPQRILAEVKYELARLQRSARVAVVVAARDEESVRALLARNSGLLHPLTVPMPDGSQLAIAVGKKIGHKLSAEVDVGKLGLAMQGMTVGEALLVCEEAARMALRESSEAEHVLPRHLEMARERRLGMPADSDGWRAGKE